MHATASFPAAARVGSSTAPRPVVFINDHPELTLRVRRITWASPLNEVNVELEATENRPPEIDLLGQSAYVATARLLRDGQTRWQVHAVGRIEQLQHSDTATQHQHHLILLDRWSEALSGASTNTSADAEDWVDALPGNPTVAEALWAIANHLHLDLSIDVLPTAVRDTPLLQTLRSGVSLRSVLETLLDNHNLLIQRNLTASSNGVNERLSVRPIELGRRIQLPFSRADQPVSPVIALGSQTQTTRAQPWIAQGDTPQIESTFTLTPGWDADLEGQPDADYDPSQSSDFSRFGNVYRRWVLNEDASLDTAAFDLASLFDQPELTATPIPFDDCLTLDDAGRPLSPIVEFSVDTGSTWSRLTEPFTLMNDRAGVTLESITLPAAILTAAKYNDLRLRVTASLTSPLPLNAQRWQGNLFADVGPEVLLDAADQFAVKRIVPSSLHDAAVKAGQLDADLRDDTQALADWLLDQLDREGQTAVITHAEAQLTLANARPEIRVGDRLDQVQADGHDIQGRPVSLQPRTASVTQVRCNFDDPAQTILTLLT